ncbi:transcriptional regulator BetI [Acuticoccus sp. M5D2P5]|uniref:choline-binding transcriptional repressor BetI n=1 Tax=Acuticoccus kalidii TaxID=2910977 RepID=UPI001F1649AC|nr:transcriptional regulator BetI [Acuticoccus kalidii]MCF3936118.1 transcriptional regulator BetI [Acuticoccus kalidii]
MARPSVQHLRRAALIEAAITEIGSTGSLDVTVSQVAKRANVSSALAHHYFGSKEQLFLAAMREILTRYRRDVIARLARAVGPLARLNAIIDASFDEQQYAREVVAAWLAFYVKAQTSDGAARLLRVYMARLHSNLLASLKRLVDPAEANRIAEEVAALIDGVYIRQALGPGRADRMRSKAMVEHSLASLLASAGRKDEVRHVAS